MASDVFPTTMRSWIGQKLHGGESARGEVNRHIMAVYAMPLRIYFSGCRDRWLGDPEDIVAGFFADRLDRKEFFADWLASGLRLRRWLANGFCFYLSELKRKRRRDGQTSETLPEDAAEQEAPQAVVDRAFVASIVREALRSTERQCHDNDLDMHWGIFFRHFHDGEPYERLRDEFEVTPARAAVMARTAARRFRTCLRDLLCLDGSTEGEVDREILLLQEGFGE